VPTSALLEAVTTGRWLAATAAATLLFAAPQPASAEVLMTPDSGGNYTVQVMSWWEIPYRTVIRQQYDFSCGSAALATLLTFSYNRPTPEHVAFAAMWKQGDQKAIRKLGFSMLDMKTYLRSIGLHAEGYRLGAKDLVMLKRPAIVLLNLKGFKHFVVVKGIQNGRVLVGDSMLGLNEYSLAGFMKIWNGVALMIVPGHQSPSFNLASDWGPWSKAPLEDGALHMRAPEFGTDVQQSYQITDQILLNVPVGTIGETQ
jgi:predicted double-glycine peptidase